VTYISVGSGDQGSSDYFAFILFGSLFYVTWDNSRIHESKTEPSNYKIIDRGEDLPKCIHCCHRKSKVWKTYSQSLALTRLEERVGGGTTPTSVKADTLAVTELLERPNR
jgi:hypothetical protein